MLVHLTVRHFAIVQELDIDLSDGMTAITGETGAGKSIAIDALSLCLGARAEAGMVRQGARKAEICATFNLAHLPAAADWLQQQELDDEDEPNCIIRRTISAEGRSKAYINGAPVPLQQLKSLGKHLINIHGQHAHHLLLKAEQQRQLLDEYAGHENLQQQVASHYRALMEAKRRYQALLESKEQREARRQLLDYQVLELNEFAIGEQEFPELETEHKRLSHSQCLLEQSQLSFHQLYESDEFNALAVLQQSVERLTELQEHDASLQPVVDMLSEASIQVDEASQQLRSYIDQLEIDPMRMQQVEQRYSIAIELARKHQVMPEQLYEHHQELLAEFESLQQQDDDLDALEQAINEQRQIYQTATRALSESRQKAAEKLGKAVETQIRQMNMSHACFTIEVHFDTTLPESAQGQDHIRFMIATNAGQPADVLEKVASGGELSRVGLALQVIASANQSIPTMIFDEVDTGISGPTASVVGQLMRRLGKSTQVLCVTHLPQVAACAHQQMLVTKFTDKDTTQTHMMSLEQEQRVEELARLLAGDKLTDVALANARELLSGQTD
ncbi:DNA repair protein RecN [Saliniradius amylolyticus]|uniref:DNA repair protein RecN n=1 Tax=Saliniradius amylolyticus TaxID=2183582 RepID=A0A2S2E3S2_9ALTE|nr:DNA repair protein RecN [Saliniradius amylolyticus]AWL12283.1 DNA repair protein RecN [Saliniradius amylolyticus]